MARNNKEKKKPTWKEYLEEKFKETKKFFDTHVGEPTQAVRAEARWDQYLSVLDKHSDSRFYELTWEQHRKVVNPHLIQTYGTELSFSEEKDIDRLLTVGKGIAEMLKIDGVLKRDEVDWYLENHFQRKFLSSSLTENPDENVGRALTLLERTDKEIAFFYLLLMAALCDSEFHEMELEFICRVAELRNRSREVLEFIHIVKSRFPRHRQHVFKALEKICVQVGDTANRYGKSLSRLNNPQTEEMLEDAKGLADWLHHWPDTTVPISTLDRLNAVITRFRNPCLKLGFVGITSSGKTALINALVGGEQLFPEKVQPTTNVGVEVRRASLRQAVVAFKDAGEEVWSGASLQPRLHEATNETTNPRNRLGIQRLVVTHPHFLFPEDIVTYDTPGLNAFLHEDHAMLTMRNLVNELDLVVYLLTVQNPLKQTDLEALNKILEKDQRIIFGITYKANLKASTVDKKKLSIQEKGIQNIDRLKTDLKSAGLDPGQFSIHLIDSRWAQWGRLGHQSAWDRSGFSPFIEDIMTHAGNLQKFQRKRCLEEARRILEGLRQTLQSRVDGKVEEQKTRLKLMNENIATIKEAKANLESELSDIERRQDARMPRLQGSFSCSSQSEFETTQGKLQKRYTQVAYETNEAFDHLKEAVLEVYSELNLELPSRHDTVNKIAEPDAPRAKIDRWKEDKDDWWNWCKSWVGCAEKVERSSFNSYESEKRLSEYEQQLSKFVTGNLKHAISMFSDRFLHSLEKELKAKTNSTRLLEDGAGQSDQQGIDYLGQGLDYIDGRLKLVGKQESADAGEGTASVDSAANQVWHPKRSGPRKWWKGYQQKHQVTNFVETLCVIGGSELQQTAFIEEILGVRVETQREQNGLREYSAEFSSLCIQSIVEEIGDNHGSSLQNLDKNDLHRILSDPQLHIALYADFPRIGSGLSEMKILLGPYLSAIVASKRLFLWNMDMGAVSSIEALGDLVLEIPQMVGGMLFEGESNGANEHRELPPVLLANGLDDRWTGFWNACVRDAGKQGPLELVKKWKEMRAVFQPPFTETVLSQLEQRILSKRKEVFRMQESQRTHA